jgi:DNA-binding MarR family transcriptional regulator
MAVDRLTEPEDRAWRGFLQTHERLWRELEAGLAPLNVSMAEYSVLALLSEAGDTGMRMSDLAEQRLMTSSGFSRLADRLQNRGLIERRRSGADGRSFDAVLTRAGRALLRRAWAQHRRDLDRFFFSKLDSDDLAALGRIWDKLGEPGTSEPG